MKIKTKIFASICLIIYCFSSPISAQECFWAAQIGGQLQEGSSAIAIDHDGNTYVTGMFCSSPCNFQTATLYCHGFNDVFIVKYDPLGGEVWVKQFGMSENGEDTKETISGIVFDSLDHTLLVTGSFYNSMILPDTVVHGRYLDVFVMKMDLDGNILWVRSGGCEFEDQSMGITYDDQENVYITGSNAFSATFGDITIPAGGFIAKYDKTGELLWAVNKFRYYYYPENPNYTEAPPRYITYSKERLLVYGNIMTNSIIIDTITLSGLWGGNSGYIASFNSDGYIQWLKQVGGSPPYVNGQFSTDLQGNIYLTGMFRTCGVFGNDTLTAGEDIYEYFLTKITMNGSFLWTIQGQSTNTAWGYVTLPDIMGNVYSGGIINDSITFGEQTLVAQSQNDMFLVSYTPDGLCRGAVKYSQGDVSGLAFDANGTLILTGSFTDSLKVGSSSLISYGVYDSFTAKCSPITSTKESPTGPSNQLLIYANPTTGKCNITVPDELKYDDHLVLYIYDSNGRLIQKANIERTSETYRLDIQAQAAGIYQAVLTNGSKSYSGKIVFTGN